MATIEVVYRVDVIESEKGWGQRVEETRDFDQLADAQKFVDKFNAVNDKPITPSWYMYATQPVEVRV